MNLKNLILAVIFLIAFNEFSHAAMPPYFKPGQFRISGRSDYFWTNANYDEFGKKENLSGSNEYNNLTNTFDGTYFFTNSLALIGGLNFSYAKSAGTIEDRTNSEITDVHARAMYKFSTSIMSLIPEFEAVLAMNPVDPLGDTVLTNEGVNTFKAGSWLYSSFRSIPIKVYGYLGYQYRDEGRSALMPWTAGLGWRGRRWLPSFEVGGYESISPDEYSNSRFQREFVTANVNAGSLRYYSVEPRLIESRFELAYAITRNFVLTGGLTYSLMGESTAQGQSVFVGLDYNFSPATTKLERAYNTKSPEGRKSREHSERLKKFEFNLEEDYDESLFEDEE